MPSTSVTEPYPNCQHRNDAFRRTLIADRTNTLDHPVPVATAITTTSGVSPCPPSRPGSGRPTKPHWRNTGKPAHISKITQTRTRAPPTTSLKRTGSLPVGSGKPVGEEGSASPKGVTWHLCHPARRRGMLSVLFHGRRRRIFYTLTRSRSIIWWECYVRGMMQGEMVGQRPERTVMLV